MSTFDSLKSPVEEERRLAMLRVLIVEDDDEMRRAIRDTFLAHGFLVRTAGDGVAAVELIQRKRYDVVVTDLRMPGMDGVVLLRILKSLAFPPRTILITAYPEWKAYSETSGLGADRILSKPLNLAQLAGLVDQLGSHGAESA
jgi:DNA-binding response OmpR family regulator